MSLRLEQVNPAAVGTSLAVSRSGRWWVSAGTNEGQIWRDGSLAAEVQPTGFVEGAPTFDSSERHVAIGGWTIELASGTAVARWSEPTWLVDGVDEPVDAGFRDFATPYVADVPGGDLAVIRSQYLPPRSRGTRSAYDGPSGQLLLVSLDSARLRRVLRSPDDDVRAVAVSASAIVAALDVGVVAWTTDGDVVRRTGEPDGASSTRRRGGARGPVVEAVALRPETDDIVTLDRTGDALISTLPGEPVASWRAHDGRARAVCWSGDGAWLATGADDGVVRVWSVDGSSVEQIGQYAGDPVAALAAGHDGRLLLVGGDVVHRGVTVLAVDR